MPETLSDADAGVLAAEIGVDRLLNKVYDDINKRPWYARNGESEQGERDVAYAQAMSIRNMIRDEWNRRVADGATPAQASKKGVLRLDVDTSS